MSEGGTAETDLDTTGGRFRLELVRVSVGGREWSIFHTGAVLTKADESRVIAPEGPRLPYGVSLWPSALALVHEIASRDSEFAGKSVLELGAGTGLPGLVAASFGARVVQTDRDELALHLCRRNAERNGAAGIEHRLADWTAWTDAQHYDWIIGADVLYGESVHLCLQRIFETNLAAGGRLLVADPFRTMSLRFFEALEADGWEVSFNRWEIGEAASPRPVGVFAATPPR